MTCPQKMIVSLLSSKRIQELARPSNIRYGQAIYNRGGVEFIASEPSSVEAWVGGLDGCVVAEGGSHRWRPRLFATDEGLDRHCAGTPKNHQNFCKHCVALALAAS